MFKEITESTLSKANEEVTIPQWVIAAIAFAAFLTGLVVGILCASGPKRKGRKFNADAYVRDLNFDIDDNADDFDDDDDEGFEFTF